MKTTEEIVKGFNEPAERLEAQHPGRKLLRLDPRAVAAARRIWEVFTTTFDESVESMTYPKNWDERTLIMIAGAISREVLTPNVGH